MNRLHHSRKHILSSIGFVVLMNCVLAVVALIKDISLANYFGASVFSDAFFIAFFITDTIGSNLIGQAISTGSIPMLAKLMVKGHEKSFFKAVYWLVAVTSAAMLLLCTGMALSSDFLLEVFSIEKWSSQEGYLTLLFMLLLPTTLLYVVNALLTAVMQVRQKFRLVAVVPVLFNLSFLVAVVLCHRAGWPPEKGAIWVSISLTVTLMFLTLLLSVAIRKQRLLSLALEEKQQGLPLLGTDGQIQAVEVVRDALTLAIPYLVVLVLVQGNLFVERSIAVHMGVGTVSALNYAYRLAQFPIWILIAAVNAVIFPVVSMLIHEGNMEKAVGHILRALRISLIAVLPIMVLLIELRVPIITLLFKRHAFGDQAVWTTIRIFEAYGFNILFQSLTLIGIRFLLAARDTKVLIGALTVALSINALVDIYLAGSLGLHVFGLGAVVGNLIASLSITFILFRRGKPLETGDGVKLFVWFAFTGIWIAVEHMLILCFGHSFATGVWIKDMALLAAFVLALLSSYYAGCYQLKCL